MTETAECAAMTREQIEERFLRWISADPLPADNLLGILRHLFSSGDNSLAEDWAQLLHETMAERKMIEQQLDLLDLRASFNADNPTYHETCRRVAARFFDDQRLGALLIDAAGFGTGIRATESVRRLRTLMNLKPGVLCCDKTWGFGVIDAISPFLGQVTVNFEKKPGHNMSLAYAAESLQLIDDSHLMAIRHRDPARLQALVREDPAEVVRIALRSYGPMTAARLQEVLQDGIVAEPGWKDFWAEARKGLKADPLVLLPAKRSERIELLSAGREYGDAWFTLFASLHDPEKISSALEELAQHADKVLASDAASRVMADRVEFVLREGAGQLHFVARILVALRQINGVSQVMDIAPLVRALLSRDALVTTGMNLPARTAKPLLDALLDADKPVCCSLLVESLPDLPACLLNEALPVLREAGMEKQCADAFRKALAAQTPSPEMLYWLARRQDYLRKWSLCTAANLLLRILSSIENRSKHEGARSTKPLQSLFEQKEWLKSIMDDMSAQQRKDMLARLFHSPAWGDADRNSLLARIIGIYPELRDAVAASPSSAETPTMQGKLTSWRSYGERMRKLQNIINVELPQNGKDLAVARSYGDLSENHAFKAAKEHQSILVNRRDTLDRELRTVKGTAFDKFPADTVGIGTRVVIERADGVVEQFFVLGEWDSDETLKIISSASQLARTLAGHKPGDKADIPGADGMTSCRVVEVSPLPPEILAWASHREQ